MLVATSFNIRNHELEVVPDVTVLYKFRERYRCPSLRMRYDVSTGNELPDGTLCRLVKSYRTAGCVDW